MKEKIAELCVKIQKMEAMGVNATDMAIAEILDLMLDMDARVKRLEKNECQIGGDL